MSKLSETIMHELNCAEHRMKEASENGDTYLAQYLSGYISACMTIRDALCTEPPDIGATSAQLLGRA